MRLIFIDNLREIRSHFSPLALGRPLWELRCGMTSLEEKLVARINPDDVAYFVPEYMADFYRTRVDKSVNSLTALAGDDLLILDPLVRAESLKLPAKAGSQVGQRERVHRDAGNPGAQAREDAQDADEDHRAEHPYGNGHHSQIGRVGAAEAGVVYGEEERGAHVDRSRGGVQRRSRADDQKHHLGIRGGQTYARADPKACHEQTVGSRRHT